MSRYPVSPTRLRPHHEPAPCGCPNDHYPERLTPAMPAPHCPLCTITRVLHRVILGFPNLPPKAPKKEPNNV